MERAIEIWDAELPLIDFVYSAAGPIDIEVTWDQRWPALDVIRLKNGLEIKGTIIKETEDEVIIRIIGFIELPILWTDIESMRSVPGYADPTGQDIHFNDTGHYGWEIGDTPPDLPQRDLRWDICTATLHEFCHVLGITGDTYIRMPPIIDGALKMDYVFRELDPADIAALAEIYRIYKLTTNVSPEGSGTITCVTSDPEDAPRHPWYRSRTVVTLTATENSGYESVRWSGDLSGTENPITITMDSDKTVTANFTVFIVTVTSDYGSPNPPVGITAYPNGSQVTVSCGPTPYPGPVGTRYVCTGWVDGTCNISIVGITTSYGPFTITQNCAITWTWKTQYYLNVFSPYGNPQGDGWYDAGATAHWSVTSPVAGTEGTQYVATPASGDVEMYAPKGIFVVWTEPP